MIDFYQGDIIKINGFKNAQFLIVSKNAFIRATNVFHVCPIIKNCMDGPLHIRIQGFKETNGVVICEQVKLIDPNERSCIRQDRISYDSIMNISDAIQGIFEYD